MITAKTVFDLLSILPQEEKDRFFKMCDVEFSKKKSTGKPNKTKYNFADYCYNVIVKQREKNRD